ncbi:MAG TPA: GNAT family N-acetyltransferase, partial [Chloroflexota bacterium]|nr:GNAT family N-acetyltransferase [Chloroflexota bacterium]
MIAPTEEYALLRDGGQVLIRPLGPVDRPLVAAFLNRLSPESRAMRFHSGAVRVSGSTLDLAIAGHVLVATHEDTIVALASYIPLRDPATAEMAIAVADAQQGRGLGTVLFERLARDAR